MALTAKEKKKFKQQDGQKKDLSTVKCFAYQKLGHYAGQCPQKKKKKKQHTTASTEVDEFTTRFEREFSLCAGHVEKERASIITSTKIQIEREHSNWP